MSIKYSSQMWKFGLTRPELAVALAIADYADNDGRCFPGYLTLAKKIGMGERQLRRVIGRLKARGVLSASSGVGRGNKKIFQLNMVVEKPYFHSDEKVLGTTSFSHDKAVELPPFRKPENEPKGGNFVQEKGAISSNPPTPPYMDNRIESSDINTPLSADADAVKSVISDYAFLMEYHRKRIETITDAPTQGKKIKELLKTFSVSDCVGCYDFEVLQLEVNGGWRNMVSWSTVLQFISEWKFSGSPNKWKKGGSNGAYQVNFKQVDAGTRNAERVTATNTIIDELRRQGAEEQALSGQSD